MFKHLYILFLTGLTFPCFSQDGNNSEFEKKNSLQLELGGHGIVYSINYERMLFNHTKYKTSIQLGMAYYPPSTGFRDTWIPLVANELFSFGNHHLEIGLGFVFNYEAGRDMENNPTTWVWSASAAGRVGYRYQKPNSQFLLRLGFTPFYELDRYAHGEKFHPFGGVSIGYAF